MTGPTVSESRRSLWIPWALCGIFAAFLIANATMVYFASRSWTGLETKDAYEKGLAYNETIAEAQAQETLGWQVGLDAGVGEPGEAWVAVSLTDREGHPVAARAVWARLVRPTHEGYDREAPLRDLGDGHYRGTLELPLPGQWDLRVRIEHAGGVYRSQRRVVLDPDG